MVTRMRIVRAPGALVVELGGAVLRGDIPAISARLREALEGNAPALVRCDLRELERVDVATVDLLLRLQLTAWRFGRPLRVRHAPAALAELLAQLGLAGVVRLEPGSDIEPERQAEEGEEPGGIEEEADPGDLPG